MKKRYIVLALAALMLCLCACGEQGGVTVDPNAVKADYGELYFSANGCDFGIFDEAAPVLEKLGEPTGTFEADSCAYQGKDLFYYYDGFELMVNDVDGVERVTGITVTDDTVANPQGVKIGMDVTEAVELMGMEPKESSGVYSFTVGSCLMRLRSDDDNCVAAMEYMGAASAANE